MYEIGSIEGLRSLRGGGVEIPIILTMRKDNAEDPVFKKMKGLVEEYYIEPEKITTVTSIQAEVEARMGDIDLDEYGPENDDIEEVVDEIEDVMNNTIVIDD